MVLEKVIVMLLLLFFLSFVQKGTRGLVALIIPSYLYGVGKLLQRKDVHIVLSLSWRCIQAGIKYIMLYLIPDTDKTMSSL